MLNLLVYYIILIVFTVNNICIYGNKCTKILPTITQYTEKSGFHRDLEYLIEIVPEELEVFQSECTLCVHQLLPSGVYVNEDQLADLRRFNQVSACSLEQVDVEAPEHLSSEINVYIYSYLNTSKVILNLPIHLRYQKSKLGGGFENVELPKPSLFVKCPTSSIMFCRSETARAPCSVCLRNQCVWQNTTYELISDPLELLVPVGNLDHYPLVAIATLLVTCAGCFYILSSLAISHTIPVANTKVHSN